MEYLYSESVLDFVRVSTEYCKYLENCQNESLQNFVRVGCGLLPMLYLKAHLIQNVPEEADGFGYDMVSEGDYNYIRGNVAAILGEHDDFLDVFVEDFKYSDQPILCTISENLADIYQQLRNMVATYQEEDEDAMSVALWETVYEFRQSWGQKLLNALRALHDLQGAPAEEE